MKKNTFYIGGFAATNTGTILNSYSLVQLDNKNLTAGGFVGKNTGRIDTSFCDTKLKNLTGGFSGEGVTASETCYFFHDEKEDSKILKDLRDTEREKRRKEADSREKVEKLAYDFEDTWEYSGQRPIIRFQPDNWIYDTDSLFEEADPDEVFTIETADELFDFASRVNGGSIIYREAHVRILKDIDLGGKEWTPIGESIRRSFNGVFDGCGHTISNFVITNIELENKGFFGFSGGYIFNVIVDCIIRGTGCIGGLVAKNMAGTIGCCGAVVTIEQKRKKEEFAEELAIGGLVGQNTGTIFESYSAGHVLLKAVLIFWPFIGIGIGAAVLITAVVLTKISPDSPNSDTAPVFNKIPEDLKQKVIEDDDSTPRTDSNFVSFQFNKEIGINLDEGTCTLDYKNPGESNHNTVVELQLTDTVAKESMGATGRDEALQAEYEAREDYDPEAYRVTIAASELIAPGYQVTALVLSDYAKQNMAPGTYEAVIMIYPYDIETNNKAMLESQLPVTIVVQ